MRAFVSVSVFVFAEKREESQQRSIEIRVTIAQEIQKETSICSRGNGSYYFDNETLVIHSANFSVDILIEYGRTSVNVSI